MRFAVLLCRTIFNATLFDPFHVFSFFFINPCRFGKTRKHLWVSLDPLKLKLTFLNIGKTKSKQVILQNKLNEQSIRSGFSILLRFGKRYYRFAVFSEVFCDMQYLSFFFFCSIAVFRTPPMSPSPRSLGVLGVENLPRSILKLWFLILNLEALLYVQDSITYFKCKLACVQKKSKHCIVKTDQIITET